MTTRGLLRAAGLVAWAFAGVPAVTGLGRDPGCMSPRGFVLWFGAFLVFGVAFWKATARAGDGNDTPETRRLIGLQSLAALVMLSQICTGFETSLLIVVAVELGVFLPMRIALPWLLGQSAVLSGLALFQMGWHYGSRWTAGALGFGGFAFAVAAIAGRELAARRELARANAELVVARERVAELTRDAERLRIARELHDLVGHDLTALHLNLEAAKHLCSGSAAAEPIARAQHVARGLLDAVRRAVSALRTDAPVDVVRAVRRITADIRTPAIHLDAPDEMELADAERANALVRCVQEIVTNAMKHSDAANLWIVLAAVDGAIEITARDDGRGIAELRPGNGITGMRERLETLGGHIELETGERRGFVVRARLPLAAAAAPLSGAA